MMQSATCDMETPAYLWNLLEVEIYRIQSELLQRIATKYGLKHDQLMEEFIAAPLKLVPNKKITIEVRKKIQPKPSPSDDLRCCARIWNRGKGGQCTRPKKTDSDYCAQHSTHLKHGDIREKVDRSIFPKQSQCLYK